MLDKEFVINRKSLNKDEIIEHNRNLCERFPFLRIKHPEEHFDFPYEYTWLDDMPDGWRIAFGEQMCEEIEDELKKIGFEDKYEIVQIKEKFGFLRWYDNGSPKDSQIDLIINKYEAFSEMTCIVCGKTAKYQSLGWISPFCENCIGEMPRREITEHLN